MSIEALLQSSFEEARRLGLSCGEWHRPPPGSDLFKQNSTKTLQTRYKSERTLTSLEIECYLFHVLRRSRQQWRRSVETGVTRETLAVPHNKRLEQLLS